MTPDRPTPVDADAVYRLVAPSAAAVFGIILTLRIVRSPGNNVHLVSARRKLFANVGYPERFGVVKLTNDKYFH